jgi:uncharacterized protein YdaU (DUF1376 family)
MAEGQAHGNLFKLRPKNNPTLKTSPSFQFYPADFLNGTMLMSAEEVGAYIRMLSYQWQQGSCPTDADDLAKITGLSAKKLARRVLQKFAETPDGLKNTRLEDARKELETFRDMAKRGGSASGAKRTGNSEWGREMAAKRQLTASLQTNEPDNEPLSEANNERPANTQSHTQSHNTPHTAQASARDDGLWPDPREYPTLETVKTWATAATAPPECAEKWHAERAAERWENRHGNPYDPAALRPLFTAYAKAWKAKEAKSITSRNYGNPKNQHDIPPSWEEEDD